MEESKSVVKELCDKHINAQDLIARDGLTFCNIFVQRVFHDLNYFGLKNKTANEIFNFCSEEITKWDKINAANAIEKVIDDYFIIASIKDDPHGHVAIVYPDHSIFSGKWGEYCPIVASVGKKNGIMGANYAFSERPSYFLYLDW